MRLLLHLLFFWRLDARLFGGILVRNGRFADLTHVLQACHHAAKQKCPEKIITKAANSNWGVLSH